MQFSKEDFVSSIEVIIRYDDLDTLGHVNNKVYLSYLEEARINYIKQVSELKSIKDFDAVVGRIDIKYLVPLLYGDSVKVYSRISRIGNKSFDIESYIIKNKYGSLIVSAYALVSMVSFDVKTGHTKKVDSDTINNILKFEKLKPVISSEG